MKKIIIILIAGCCLCTVGKSQVVTEEYPNKALVPESLFVDFEYPKLPSYIKRDFNNFVYEGKETLFSMKDIIISVYVNVNESGNVSSLKINPLFGIGENIPKDDKFWEDMDKSIRESAKKWKFRTLYFPKDHDKENPYINTKPMFRPYYGRQSHLMILVYNSDLHIGGIASFMYWLDPPLDYLEYK